MAGARSRDDNPAMALREEIETRTEHDGRYASADLPALVAVEHQVLGSDYGANGYTTHAQAARLAEALGLGPGRRLLDLGAGCGWPGLYLARSTGCAAVLTDLTATGMAVARARTRRDGLAGRVATVVASARHLPYRPDCFDAVVHTDVLC